VSERRADTSVRFLGAAGEVTGSCFLVEHGRARVLVDCGLVQGNHAEEQRNRAEFEFDARQVDAVVLSHAHIDHSGRLPLLVQRGFGGTIHAHRATRDLCRILLRDSAHLMAKDAELENRRRERRGAPLVEPLYAIDDVDRALEAFRGADYGTRLRIAPGIECVLHDAGHLLGSAIVELVVGEGAARRTLVFSGDLGHRGTTLLPDPARLAHADAVVMESTYGDRDHRSWEATVAELGEVLREAADGRGNVLIPAFSVGRTQELLYLMGRFYDEWDMARWHVFVDSPPAIAATEIYASHWALHDPAIASTVHRTMFRLPNLHFSQTPEQSMAINQVRSGAIIIAGSGMCTGGRIRHHLKHHLWRRGSHVVIVGYQAGNTLGRRLVDGAKQVMLWGEPVNVAAQVHTINGLSAHADQRELLEWYGAFRDRPEVALVHGEARGREPLAALLRARGARVRTPQRDEAWAIG
jgi:metallo-beta-lactamase family protein